MLVRGCLLVLGFTHISLPREVPQHDCWLPQSRYSKEQGTAVYFNVITQSCTCNQETHLCSILLVTNKSQISRRDDNTREWTPEGKDHGSDLESVSHIYKRLKLYLRFKICILLWIMNKHFHSRGSVNIDD